MHTRTKTEAIAANYHPLTTAYHLPEEQAMMDNVIADMERGGINATLVTVRGGKEVWRKKNTR